MKNIFLALFLALNLFSCKPNLENNYKNNFKSYLVKEHNLKPDSINNAIIYVIDIDADCICTELNVKLATESYKKLIGKNIEFYLILIGSGHNGHNLDKYLADSQVQKIILKDKAKSIFRYETGFYKPMITHINDGDYLLFKVILDLEIESIEKYLLNLLK